MADSVTLDQASPSLPSAPKSTTAKTLRVLCVLLLTTTAVVLGTSLWVFQRMHSTVEKLRADTAPAILAVLATQDALVKADSAAIGSFHSGEVKLSGPGLQHQNQLTFASQSLAQVAEHNTAGQRGSERIQLLEGLLESYSSLIGQAHAHFGTAVGTADLWSASRLLHTRNGPILNELDELLKDQNYALRDQIDSSSMTIWALLLWAVPIVLLFVLLGVTQLFLQRRFRRAMNPFLLLATAVLVGLSSVTSLALESQHQLEKSRDTLNLVVREWRDYISAAQLRGQWELVHLVAAECTQQKGGCGPTVNQLTTDREPAAGMLQEDHDRRVAMWTRNVDEQIKPAAKNSRYWFLIPLATALIAALIPCGLWPRIEEYRYRPK
jgi:hypothetical protein